MYRILRQRDFDTAGVRTSKEQPVVGFVRRDRLKSGTIRDHLETIPQDQIIPETLPLRSLMLKLKDSDFVFVKINNKIGGIITRADLNKPPVRVYLFGLLSLFEMHLSYWLRAAYPEDSWQKVLNSSRLRAAKKLQTERRRRKQDLDLIECLQFGDKRDLILARDNVRNDLALGSKRLARTKIKHAEDLRNLLDHSQYDLVRGTSWKELIELVQWLEAVIDRSDTHVDQRVRQTASSSVAELW
jgi:hypothetical protein